MDYKKMPILKEKLAVSCQLLRVRFVEEEDVIMLA